MLISQILDSHVYFNLKLKISLLNLNFLNLIFLGGNLHFLNGCQFFEVLNLTNLRFFNSKKFNISFRLCFNILQTIDHFKPFLSHQLISRKTRIHEVMAFIIELTFTSTHLHTQALFSSKYIF